MKRKEFLAVCALFILLRPAAGARPGPVLNIADLSAGASLIAVGEILSIRQVGVTAIDVDAAKVSARAMTAELRVDQVLKGHTTQAPVTVHFSLPDEPIGYSTPRAKYYGVFFLKLTDKQYQFVSPHFPSVVAIPGTAVQGDPPLARAILQVGAVLRSPLSSSEQKRQAVWTLSTTQDASAVEALREGARDNDLTVKLSSVGVLVARNDISQLSVAIEALLRPPQSVSSEVIHNLARAIGSGIQDPQAIPELVKLQVSDDPITRRGAVMALMRTNSPNAIPALTLALDDADRETRFSAVMGLADITGQRDWRPTRDEFLSREESYLKHWKEWEKLR